MTESGGSSFASFLSRKEDSSLPRLLILDCDGVLIDSEVIASRVMSRCLHAVGWDLSPQECEASFTGMTLGDVARRLGLGSDWVGGLAAALLEAMAEEAEPVPGAVAFVEALVAREIAFRVASNSSRAEIAVKFRRTGLERLIPPPLIHSAGDVIAQGGRGKPAPDVYLAAAAAAGVAPSETWVVEDSPAGVTAATSAGMLCYGFGRGRANPALTALGAVPLSHLHDLLPLLPSVSREAS